MITAGWNRDAVGSHEVPAILEVLLDSEATLVHQRVVFRTERHQVFEAGLTAVRPVLDVVTVKIAVVVAAREGATIVVSRPHGTFDACLLYTSDAADED